MPVVFDPALGLKPSQTLAGGSRAGLAPNSQPLSGYGGGSVTMVGGRYRTVSFARLARTQPWVRVASSRLSEQMARLPQHVLRMGADGETRQRDRTHGAAVLLDNPRPGLKGFHLRWEIAQGLYVDGHSLHWKRRPATGAPPRELWRLDWRKVTPHRIGDAGPIVAWEWHGDGIPDLARGTYIFPEDVLSIGFNPVDGELGVSPLESLGVTLRLEDALQRHTEAAFRNGTRFGALVRLHKDVTADKVIRDGLRDELIDAHGGLDQAFRPAILGGGVEDIETLTQTAVEAELISQRKVNREEVVAVYGIDGPLAGILDKSNSYGSLKEFHRLLYVTKMGGPLGLVDASMQGQLIDGEPAWRNDGVFVEYSLDAVLKGDAKERWETYGLALDHGGLTLNDVRKSENKPPYGDPNDPENPANQPLIAANNVRPLSAVVAGGGDAPADQAVAQSILSLVGKHSARAFERAGRGAGAGKSVLEALDRGRVARELAADLEVADVKGVLPRSLADSVAGELEHALEGAKSLEDVRRIANAYAFGGNE